MVCVNHCRKLLFLLCGAGVRWVGVALMEAAKVLGLIFLTFSVET
jgi:hypothetical protein